MFSIGKEYVVLLVVILMSGCSFNSDNSEPKVFDRNKRGLDFKVTHLNKSAWPPAKNIEASARLDFGDIQVRVNCEKLKEKLMKVCHTAKREFKFSRLKYKLLINGKLLNSICKSPHKISEHDSLKGFSFFDENLHFFNGLNLDIPIYELSNFKSDELLSVKLHVWQDEFYTDKYRVRSLIGTVYSTKDTLVKQLINSEFSFQFKMPQLYKTQFVIDSLFLQDDSTWSPKRSDFVLWGSSYPDLYVSVDNEYVQTTDETHVEKSTGKFTEPDTIYLLHYSDDSKFRLVVRDKDGTGNEIIGDFSNELNMVNENVQYRTEFDPIKRFYFKKKFLGKAN